MKAKEAVWGWTSPYHRGARHPGKVVVAHIRELSFPSVYEDPLEGCEITGGAVFPEIANSAGKDAQLAVLAEFNAAVVRDHMDPQKAHKEFLKIDEYRDAIAPDIPGACPGRLSRAISMR
jgi:hypothetical protein